MRKGQRRRRLKEWWRMIQMERLQKTLEMWSRRRVERVDLCE